ncbi:hypothetical protein PIROE2DRAFT_56982 [Piromyces sp. E2]|nr:hypothetical protein PIROE2DRAFT_56982 [Piromyces sp. E2]|eukprot:OUM70100.1 hypothetical protein PIROE2DRAFT_56982 [Piromyces sp. E2]
MENKLSNDNRPRDVSTDEEGIVVITSYDVPSNHFSETNSFKGVDTDVERFLGMCEKQFDYFVTFYSSEKRRVEFIEVRLGKATEWYYIFQGKSQKDNPDSKSLLNELEVYYLTNLPNSLKLKRLKELSHKWDNAVDFVTKFKLYTTQLNIPEIIQLELLEERIHPFIKEKLLNLEPKRRNIDSYCKMLITYDNERDKHWNLNNYLKWKSSSSNNETFNNKKIKNWNENQNPVKLGTTIIIEKTNPRKKPEVGFLALAGNPTTEPSFIHTPLGNIPRLFIRIKMCIMLPSTGDFKEILAILNTGSGIDMINDELVEELVLPLLPNHTKASGRILGICFGIHRNRWL